MNSGNIHNPASKKKRDNKNERHTTIKFEDFPGEISIDIISRLPITSLVKFKFANQLCRQLSHDPTLVPLYFSRSLENNPTILFLNFPSTRNIYFVELLRHSNKEIVRKIQTPIYGANIVASCNGILCLSDSSKKLHVYNPFTNRHEELITSYSNKRERFLGFGYHPLAKEYVIIKGSIPCRDLEPYINLGSLNRRRSIRKVKLPQHLEWVSCPQAFVNGRFHWVSVRFTWQDTWPRLRLVPGRKIFSFDLLDEQFREIALPRYNFDPDKEKCHLTVLGDLLSVGSDQYGSFDIWVMKEYGVSDSWEKILSIENFPISKSQRHIEIKRVLCISEKRNILVLYSCGIIVSYDLENGDATEIVLRKKPPKFEMLVHVASLNWIDTPISTSTI